ncbi:hypothetical protein DPMN_054071 [Dreissena polymorpha]|uniref:Uncharacterized protein n=1 Tax=Dreissena polymorpha TaxID=45954 RepID=A0A9D4HQW5_DREPO|nr:hypothetical protein DPMN_054071 [Dreissena polymorpha]
MATKKSDITPVFNDRRSIALVDTAENLVDSLDNLSVCLRHIEARRCCNKIIREYGINCEQRKFACEAERKSRRCTRSH